ncbi:YdcF family protein [Corynebacterium camporealensis]
MNSKQCEAIVVLGAAQYNGRPSRILSRRLDGAVEVLRSLDKKVPIITVGGKLEGDNYTEAGVARDYLHKNHGEDLEVYAIEEGLDTEESLNAIKDALGYRDILIATDPLHCLRAGLIGRRAGFHAHTVGVEGHNPKKLTKAWWKYLAHEAGGLVVLAVAAIAGDNIANSLKSSLHRIEEILRPNQKNRHDTQRKRSQ